MSVAGVRGIVLVACWIILAVPGWAQLASGGGLNGLAQLQDGVSHRESSADPMWKTGNGDMRPIEAGDTLVLADIQGPGVITHLWNTIASSEEGYPRLLLLRMYWDGEDQPSVEVPLGDFFGIGHGMNVPFQSLPVAVSSSGNARNCYWPMPFRKSAKITVTNEGKQPVSMFFYYVDWQKLDRLSKKTGYFHAYYHQEFPPAFGKRYPIASIEGRGHYVGTALSVRARLDSWIGEGDDFFYVDGDEEPTLRGTGTEDYFCDAWGFREFAYPYYGVPLFQGYKTGDKTSVYRWHIADPVRFKKSLEVEIEHVGPTVQPDGSIGGYGTRPDDFSSVAYWYQQEPHKPFPPIPHGYDRFPPKTLTGNPFEDVAAPGYIESWAEAACPDASVGAVVNAPNGVLTEATVDLKLVNPLTFPASVTVTMPTWHGVTPTPGIVDLVLDAKSERSVPIKLVAQEPVRTVFVSNLPVVTETTFTVPDGATCKVTKPGCVAVKSPFPVASAAQPITIDGDPSDWAELPFDIIAPYRRDLEPGVWTGPKDCSFRFGVAADQDWLYIAVNVKDNTIIRTDSIYPWAQDGVEIRVVAAPDPERSAWRGESETAPALLAAMSPKTGKEKALVFKPESLPAGTQTACVKTDTGYCAEVAIPAAALDAIQGKAWQAVRINIAIDDRDSPDKFCQVWWRPDWRTENTFDGSGTFVRP